MMSFERCRGRVSDFLARPLAPRTFWSATAGLVLLALLLRLLFALPALAEPSTLLRPDSASYLDPARALAAGDGLATAPGSTESALLRPPGYPLLLALIFRLFGDALLPAALAGCLLGATGAIPLALAGRRVAGGRAGLLAGLLWALNPTAIAQSPLFLSDNLFGVLAAWQCYAAIRMLQRKKTADFALLALLAVAATWVKPVNLPVVIIGLPVLALAAAASSRQWVRFVLAAGAVFAVLLLPWWMHNYRLTGGFEANTANIYFHNGSAVMAAVTGESSELWRDRLIAGAEAEFRAHPERYPTIREQNAWKQRQFAALFRQYPLPALRTHLPHWANLLPDVPTLLENNHVSVSGRGTMAVLRQRGLFAAADYYLDGRWYWLILPLPLLLVTAATYGGAVITLWRWLRLWQWRMLLVFGVLVFYYLWAPGPVISPRYALPALSFLTVMAAGAVGKANFMEKLHSKSEG